MMETEPEISEIEETYSTDGPICPYCGHGHRPDEPAFYQDGDFWCDDCGRKFDMDIHVSHSWTCRPCD